ncbi:31442_t:CDS:2, partial [Racocetra persica]
MATNTDLAKAKGSAETYAVKYFLQKFFLLPVDSNLDPDAFDGSPMIKEKEETKLPPRQTITTQQVESLINLFRSKTADNKERQTRFLEELDKVLEKKGIKEKTTSGNFRERLQKYLIATYKIFQEGEKGGVYSEFSQISACKSPFITEVTRKSYYLDQQYMILKKKHRFIEITGAGGKVKFTNFPTPQSTFTLSKETLEIHIS